jgi:hypothetical protein
LSWTLDKSSETTARAHRDNSSTARDIPLQSRDAGMLVVSLHGLKRGVGHDAALH